MSDGGMTETTREPTVEHWRVLTRPWRIISGLTVSSAAWPSAMLFEISSPVVALNMANPVEITSPDEATSPSPSSTTVRSVFSTCTGKSNSTVGLAPNSPPTVMASEAAPLSARQSDAPTAASDFSGASSGALQAASPATRPRTTRSVADLRTGDLTKKETGCFQSGVPAADRPTAPADSYDIHGNRDAVC